MTITVTNLGIHNLIKKVQFGHPLECRCSLIFSCLAYLVTFVIPQTSLHIIMKTNHTRLSLLVSQPSLIAQEGFQIALSQWLDDLLIMENTQATSQGPKSGEGDFNPDSTRMSDFRVQKDCG